MKILRGLGALVVWLLATVVMVLALVLSVTIILLPVGIPLFAFGLRIYGYGVQLMIPGSREVKRGLRGRLGLRKHGSLSGDAKRAGKKTRKQVSKKAKDLKGRMSDVLS